MLVYKGTKKDFMQDCEDDVLADKIEQEVLNVLGRRTPKNEIRSWVNSMQYMYKVLNDKAIPETSGVAIEYNIPMTSKRVDFILSGYDDAGNGHAEIIELKQWERATPVSHCDAIVETYIGKGLKNTTHPSYQAWSYAEIIRDYNETIEIKDIELHPCAYLHNFPTVEVTPLRSGGFSDLVRQAPLFAKGEISQLRDFIKSSVYAGDNQEIMRMIDNGRLKPSKSLQDALASMLNGNREFVLIDAQKEVFEMALHLARQSANDGIKRVLIIEGGPGTGKSVVAINLLIELINDGQLAQYISKNSAPRNVYKAMLKGARATKNIDSLFRSSGTFVEAEYNSVDTLIIDESHRLNAKSGMFSNKGENQIKEIINAAACSIFFIDESQRVTMKDIGSVAEIEKWAFAADCEIYHHALDSQFRCNGSDGYLAWVDDTLEIRETANYSLKEVDYDFIVCESPEELEELVVTHNQRNKARILAGYCWEWPKAGQNKGDVHDIVIGDWSKSWNLGSTSTYAIDPESINEVGCIHTTQGLEFDFVGVIIGEDMRFDGNRIITDFTKRAKTDQSIKGLKKLSRTDAQEALKIADEIIKNTYKTLMTRGMKGCCVYCVDAKLRDYLRARANQRYEYHLIDLSDTKDEVSHNSLQLKDSHDTSQT